MNNYLKNIAKNIERARAKNKQKEKKVISDIEKIKQKEERKGYIKEIKRRARMEGVKKAITEQSNKTKQNYYHNPVYDVIRRVPQ